MANTHYDNGLRNFLEGNIAWLTDTIKLVLVDGADYSPSVATHDALDDIPVAARVAISGAFASKSSTGGVADAGDVTLTSVTGDEFEYIVLFKDSGVESTSWLIGIIDTATNLPLIPNGGNVTVAWDNGTNRIFKL